MPMFENNIYENVRTRVIVLHQNRMLLLSPDRPGAGWRLPGGGLFPNESLAECGEREVMEETGIAVRVDRVAFLREFVVPKYCPVPEVEGEAFSLEVHLYAAPTTDQIEPRPESPDAPMPHWIPFDKVSALPLWPKELKTLALALASGNSPQAVPSFVSGWESPDAPAPDVVF